MSGAGVLAPDPPGDRPEPGAPIPALGNLDSGPFRPGDVVQVRCADEILATLDAEGRLDGLPFMPEMLRFCGQTATVHRRAERTCDTIDYRSQRRVPDTVHLAGLRCDGQAHGGCQAGCLLFWKEAWLTRPAITPIASAPSRRRRRGEPLTGRPSALAGRALPVLDVGDLESAARRPPLEGSSAPRFMCQATEINGASIPMPWWRPGQYVRDVTSGNARPLEVMRGLALWLFVRVQKRLINGSKVPFMKGRLTKTPKVLLDLQPGERVRVRSKREIEATLNADNRNRGLSFDAEMLRYIGGEFTVARRVERIIDEKTGELTPIGGDCIVLEGVHCTSDYHRLCPRSIEIYWREIWLERVAAAGPAADDAGPRSREPSGDPDTPAATASACSGQCGCATAGAHG